MWSPWKVEVSYSPSDRALSSWASSSPGAPRPTRAHCRLSAATHRPYPRRPSAAATGRLSCDAATADRVCCKNRHFAEHFAFFACVFLRSPPRTPALATRGRRRGRSRPRPRGRAGGVLVPMVRSVPAVSIGCEQASCRLGRGQDGALASVDVVPRHATPRRP